MNVQNISSQVNTNSIHKSNNLSFGGCVHRRLGYDALDEAQRFLKSIKGDAYNSSKACNDLRTIYDKSDSKDKMDFVNAVMDSIKLHKKPMNLQWRLEQIANIKKGSISDSMVMAIMNQWKKLADLEIK